MKKKISFDPKTPGDDILRDIQTIQRLYKITTNHEDISQILKEGLHSAINICQIHKESFVEMYHDEVGGKKVAKGIWDFAKRISDLNASYVAAHLRYVAQYDDDELPRNELRELVKLLCEDKRLYRSFQVYFEAKGNE